MTKGEQETVLRWDREERCVTMWTADPAQARNWTRNGYSVTAVVSTTDGRTTGWRAVGPVGCIRFRRVLDGQIIRRVAGGQNHGSSRRFSNHLGLDKGDSLGTAAAQNPR